MGGRRERETKEYGERKGDVRKEREGRRRGNG